MQGIPLLLQPGPVPVCAVFKETSLPHPAHPAIMVAGIVPEEIVEPMPPTLRALCRRLTRWHILPRAAEPDSAIVNIYEEGDCIPPHVSQSCWLHGYSWQHAGVAV